MMSSGGIGATRGDVLRLFDGGSVAGLGDGELLGRFVAGRDEVAFETLVARLGPMVLGVCRRMLADPHDIEDAFQATFLVLVRRAGSIRDRDVVATWLYEVAVRVARRARLDASRRSERERRGAVSEAREESTPGLERSEVRARIDEEIGRLPESHRRLVVLCDVEGLSREEAAARLGWTANMVRGRLERARGRLRDRLTRRGLSPSGAWLALAIPSAAPRPALVAATIRSAMTSVLGRSPVAGLASSAPAVALSEGVVRMMMLSKWKLAASAVLSTGVMLAGSGMLAAGQGPGDGRPPATPKVAAPAALQPRPDPPGSAAPAGLPPSADQAPTLARPSGADDPFQPRSAAELASARIAAAQARLDAQIAFYEEGRITIDRLIAASRGLMEAVLDSAGTKADRVAAARAHHLRLREVLRREQAELAAGRATVADVGEANTGVLDAEFLLAREIEAPEPAKAEASAARPGADVRPKGEPRKKSSDLPALARARVEITRRILAGVEAQAVRGAATPGDVDRARLAVVDAEILEAREAEGAGLPGSTGPGPEVPGAGLPGPPAAIPSPAGALPTTGSRAGAEPGPSSLAGAIAAFNDHASSPAVGWSEPPLTEDEVIAAIRLWQPNQETSTFANGVRTNVTPPESPVGAFKAVAETRRMPPGARFEVAKSKDVGDDCLYAGWWVSLVMSRGTGEGTPKSGFATYWFPIRERLVRPVSLEEVLEQEKAGKRVHTGLILPESLPLSERIKNLEDRIKWRDQKLGK